MPTPKSGRPRTLDRNKKSLLCNAVSRGATMGEAAAALGVSIRTIQREARRDARFDEQLRLAHLDTPDPLAVMQNAARTHWRAAAWLLERTNPEEYGRRPTASCSPFQFERAMMAFIELALQHTPLESRSGAYASMQAIYDQVFDAVFPNYGPRSRHLACLLTHTPLTDAERRKALRDPSSRFYVPDKVETIEELAAPATERAVGFTPTVPSDEQQPLTESVSDRTFPTVPNSEPQPLAETASDRTETPPSPRSADLGSTELAEVSRAEPDASQSPPPAPRLPWRYILRAARTSPVVPNIPISANIAESSVLSHLSPKTRSATEFESGDSNPPATPPHSAPSPNPVE